MHQQRRSLSWPLVAGEQVLVRELVLDVQQRQVQVQGLVLVRQLVLVLEEQWRHRNL
jgi:hypothetical protein